MAIYFLDSSALVKRYVAETGSSWIGEIFTSNIDLHISAISGAEVIAAIIRRQRRGALLADDAARALTEFRTDWTSLFDVVKVDTAVIERAMDLAEQHGLRGSDSIQLAAAMRANAEALQSSASIVFVCADDELNTAASAEGLQFENPNRY